MCCHYDHRALSVSSVKSLVKVGLLSLGRDTSRRTGTLNIHNDERKLCHYRKSHSL